MALYDEEPVVSTTDVDTAPPAPPAAPTVPFEHYDSLNAGYREAEARAAAAEASAREYQQQVAQANQRMAALEQRLQAQASQPARTPEEAQQREQARKALRELQSDDPDYARVLQLAKAAPALAKAVVDAQQQIAEIRQGTTQSFARGEEGRLYQMASQAGLPVGTPAQFQSLNRYVAGIIRSDPEALRDFQRGDPRVTEWALSVAKQDFDAQTQSVRAQTAQTKASFSRLPPRGGHGQPGTAPPTLPKFDASDPGARERAMFANARRSIRESLAQTG